MFSSSFTYLGVGEFDPCVVNGPILPSAVPIPRVDPDELEAAAGRLRTVGEAIAQSGIDITSTWAGLEGIYTAPESGELLSVIDPVGSDTAATQEAVTGAADALTTFAETARPLKEELIRLQGKAVELWEEVDGDQEWSDDDDLRERNNYLNNRIAQAVFEFQTAERTCANAIGASYGGTYFRGVSDLSAADPGQTSDGRDGAYYGTFTAQVDADNPWGAPAQASTPWYEDVWAGVADAAVGVVTGTATALGLRDADGEAVYPLSPENFANIGAELENSLVGLGNLSGFFVDGDFRAPGSADDWYATARGPWIEAFEAVVPISEWEDRPGYVIATGAVNVGSAAFGLGAIKVGNDLLGGAARSGDVDVDVDAGSGNPASTDSGPTVGPFEVSHGPDGASTPVGGDLSPSLEGGSAQELGRMDTALAELNDTAEGFSTPASDGVSAPVDTPEAAASPDSTTFADSSSEAASTAEEGSFSSDATAPVSDASTTSQDPTVQEVQDAQVLAEMLREDPALAEAMSPELAEEFRALDPDSPWQASAVRQPEMAMAGGGSDTPNTTITNSTGDIRTGGGGTVHDTPVNGDSTSGSHVNGLGDGPSTIDQAGGHGPTPSGSDRLGGSDDPSDLDGETPLDPNRRDAYTRVVRTQEVIRVLGLNENTKWSEFASGFTDLINRRPDLFNEFYDRSGSRRSIGIQISGHTIPQITSPTGSPPWFLKDSIAPPDRPDYLTEGDKITVRADPDDPSVSHLHDLANERREAIEADRAAEQILRDRRDRYPEGHQEIIDAENDHSPKHARMTTASEDFGEALAEAATREQFDGQHTVTLNDGTEVELPRLSEDAPVVHSTRPTNGNHQFDQIWRTEDGGIVIVEAKSSTGTALGERTVSDANGDLRRVSQGSREYLEDVLVEMRGRGRRDANLDDNELTLADEIQDALDNDKLYYVEVKGIPDGNRYGGYTFGLFDISD
ncbi:hypothetical protein AB0I72_19565 [Nocardiopsis sp. NPDC049922]|uniref:hypothetical protein n=1 Tax=Nocardiopsis sp. NPDC049922 TaxID=3155157 RepID=UPI003404F5AC